jgi:class 3 adenylate cyclase
MDLVERFVAASDWTTSKKTAVAVLGFWLPSQVIQYLITRFALAPAGYIDPLWVDTVYAAVIALSAAMGGLCLVLAHRGIAAEWSFYVVITGYLVCVTPLVYAVGDANVAVTLPAVLPALFVAGWYDWRKALYAGVVTFTAMAAVAAATVSGFEYAPAVVPRDIDAVARLPMQVAGFGVILPALVAVGLFFVLVGEALRRERTALSQTRDQLSDAVALISKYVPAELASGILSGAEAPSSGYRRQKVTSFFSDIVGFTELAEELEPEELARMLNEYFTVMAAIAERHHGTVDELQGDGLILVFGAPTFRSDREHALDAVRAAIEMQVAIGDLNERWRQDGLDVRITVRMGMNTGVVTVGHFGSGNRLKYTVLGKHVNLAARIQAMCEPGGVLISHATWLLVNEEVATRSLGEHPFKGITRPVEVHELVDRVSAA